MKQHEQILVKHKDFIKMVATDNINPSRGNDYVMEILAAFNEIDTTVESVAECATCQHIYTTPFKIILAYCESKNWFEVQSKAKK